jgi:DNA polymerase-3 subunit gamma/tau
MARLFAKTVNCLEPKKETGTSGEKSRTARGELGRTIEPCNQCEQCLEFNANRSLDLVEIDAASNRGIDEIRELREGVKFNPMKSKYKVFIIDEVHMLTTYAFNALLKTLEEPPERTIFILATTDPDKVPPTILSRVQRFDFRKLGMREIISNLSYIAEQEKLSFDDNALKLIAYLADGSVRDAQSILSQVVAFSHDKTITEAEVEDIVGSVNLGKVIEFLKLLADKDLKSAIAYVNALQDQEYQLQPLVRLSLELLEKIMVLQAEPSSAERFSQELAQDQIKDLEVLAKKMDKNHVRLFARGFLSALSQIKKSVLPTLPIELVIMEVLGEEKGDKG